MNWKATICVFLLLLLLAEPSLVAANSTPSTVYLGVGIKPQDTLPASVDNSQTQWFPPIGLQNHGCTAFSVGYYIKTFQEAKEHGWDLSGAKWEGYISGKDYGHPTPSYQDKIMSPAFIYNLNDPSGSIETAMKLVCNIGDCTWEAMPYDGYSWTDWPSDQAWTEAALYRGNSTVGYQYIDLTSDVGIATLKSLLASQNLASFYVDSSKLSKANLAPADFLTLDNYNSSSHDHVNTIVGYDDNATYTENGTTHYGAFKIANSYGAGIYNWENIPDGFYWISYETMKQQFKTCLFFEDLIGYKPDLMASFKIAHAKRSDTTLTISVGSSPNGLITKRFSSFVSGYPYPYSPNDYLAFPDNSIVLDVTEFENYLPSILGQTFWLSVYDGGSATTGTITSFSINSPSGYQASSDVSCQTVNNNYVYLSINYSSPGPFPTPSPSPTSTLTPSPTALLTASPTQTITSTPTSTPKPTATPTPTLTQTPNPTITPTTPTPSPVAIQAQPNFMIYAFAATVGTGGIIAILALVLKAKSSRK